MQLTVSLHEWDRQLQAQRISGPVGKVIVRSRQCTYDFWEVRGEIGGEMSLRDATFAPGMGRIHTLRSPRV